MTNLFDGKGNLANLGHVIQLRKDSRVSTDFDNGDLCFQIRLAIPDGKNDMPAHTLRERRVSDKIRTKQGTVRLDELPVNALLEFSVKVYGMLEIEQTHNGMDEANGIIFPTELTPRDSVMYWNRDTIDYGALADNLRVDSERLTAYLQKRILLIMKRVAGNKREFLQWKRDEGNLVIFTDDGEEISASPIGRDSLIPAKNGKAAKKANAPVTS